MKKLFALFLVVAVVASLGLVGCTPKVTEPKEEKVLKLSISSEPDTFDVNLGFTPMVGDVTYGIFEPLVRATAEGIVPAMAESWTVSDDGLVYTFKIRDAKWSDGQPVTAQHFVDSILRVSDPNVPSTYGSLSYYFVNGKEFNEGKVTDKTQVGVKAIDAKTLQMTLTQAYGYFINALSFTGFNPIRLDMVEKAGQAYGTSAETMVYCGPYILKEWKHEEVVLLEKNPTYWNADKVNIDKVEIHIVPDSATRANMYETGALDMTDLEKTQIELYKDSAELQKFANGSLWFLEIKLEGATANRNLINALAYAIDRQTIADQVLSQTVIPATRIIPDVIAGAEGKYDAEHPNVTAVYGKTADIEKAKALLQTALTELNLKSVDELPTFYFLADERDQNRMMAELLQDTWKTQLGVKTEIHLFPVKQKYEEERLGNFQINWTGWGPDFDDAMGYLYAFETGANYASSLFSDAEFDQLLRDSNTEKDLKARGEILAKAEQIILDRGAFVPVYFKVQPYLVKPYVKNLIRSAVGMDLDYINADIQK